MQYPLRDYTSLAKKEHLCNYCCRYIQVGERYNVSVYALSGNGIMVVKSHSDGCDFFDPFEEDLLSQHSGKTCNLESKFEKNTVLKTAA